MAKGTIKCSANYIPLTPITFLERSAVVYSDRTSIVYGDLKFTYKQTLDRCRRLASALSGLGVSRGDVVAVLAPNIPATYELHFAVPMAGAVLCPLNTLLDSSMVSVLLAPLEAKLIFVDHQFLDLAEGAFKIISEKGLPVPSLVLIQDHACDDSVSGPVSKMSMQEVVEYESFLAQGEDDFVVIRPNDECDPITVSYSSGTTAIPKGVVYSHRGAYLNSLASILIQEMQSMPVYLWTVPMFHCNGWCLIWGMAAQGGTSVCLRNVTAKVIFDSIAAHQVTHMGGAPTILNMIGKAAASERKPLGGRKVFIMTGGAPPPPQVLLEVEEQGFGVTHAYGMTETYGAAGVCCWKPEWNSLPLEAQVELKARQGVKHLGMEEIDVKDPDTMQSVPKDGKTLGEVMLRGNTVMSGYLNDVEANEEAFRGGWYHTGDMGVMHSDGYLEVKDRSTDIIVCGEETLSSVEVESVIFSHPAVAEAAVVRRPDAYWGETPCAFVKLKKGCTATEEDIIDYCRDWLPHNYMVPRTVVFQDLPKTSTGKTKKYVLRAQAKAMATQVV